MEKNVGKPTRILPLQSLKDDEHDDYYYWREIVVKYENAGAPQEIINYCIARSYVAPDGFFYFCKQIMEFRDLDDSFHMPIASQSTSKRRYRLLLASRGSFKSSIATEAYTCWLMAREYILLGTCNIRILIGSEVINVATKFMRAIRQTLEFNKNYTKYFGKHRGGEHRKTTGRVWSDTALISQYRTVFHLGEPTVSTISLGAPRAGYHYDVILADDLETERASATGEQIDKCISFYRLLHALLEPQFHDTNPIRRVVPDPIMQLTGTRWHHGDVYQHVIDGDEEEDFLDDTYDILIAPVELEDGTLRFPSRFSRKKLDHLKKRYGDYHYACQVLLDPTPETGRTFKSAWINIATPQHYTQTNVHTYLGVDLAFTPQARIFSGEVKKADYTVFLVVNVDENMNYIIYDWFRERVNKRESMEVMFSMCQQYRCRRVALQKYDRSQIDETIRDYAKEVGYMIPYEYVSYPPQASKHDRIETNLVNIAAARKLWLKPDMKWLEEEFFTYPRQKHDDGLDALCNVVRIATRPAPSRMPSHMTNVRKHVEGLKSGKLILLDGTTPKKRNTWHIFRR